MQTHSEYTGGIGKTILEGKSNSCQTIDCMKNDISLYETALVMVARLYNFHVCVLMESKFT